jgi:glycosyltransferase involved in cell wall biosynthesis
MKKVLHLQMLPVMYGAQRFSLHLLDGLSNEEFEVWVASKPGGEFVQEVRNRGYHYISLPTLRHQICLWDLLTLFHLLYIFKKQHFDIVHTNGSKPGFLGRLAARICKIPLIIHTSHGFSFQDNQNPLVYRFFTLAEKFGNQLGDYSVFVNNSDRLKSIEMGLIKPEKAITIYNALPKQFSNKLQNMAKDKKEPKQEIIIGSTLRYSTQKNVINLITASCKACLNEPKLKFIYLGDGEYYDLCQAIIHSFGLEKRILLVGWDKNVLPWLKVLNVFVLYSRWEAMPFSIIEAMSSGLAVIASDIPPLSELVNKQTGYIVPLNNNAKLVKTFIEVARDTKTAYQKGQLAALKINELCNYDNMVNSYRELYLSAKSKTARI